MYSPHQISLALLLILGLGGAPFGCSSAPTTADPTLQAPAPQKPASAADIFAQYLPYMPADTASVAIFRTQMLSELMQDVFATKQQEGEKEHLLAMREDFRSLLLDTLGVDPLSADSVVAVISPSAQFIILERTELADLGDADTTDAHGMRAYYIAANPAEPDAGFGAWVAPFPQTETVAVFADKHSFEAAAAAYANTADGLAGTPNADALAELLSAPKISVITGAVFISDAMKLEFQEDYGFAPPEAVAFHIDREIRVDFRGDETSLDGIKFYIEVFRSAYLAEIERQYQIKMTSELEQAAGAILAYHLSYSLDDSIVITRGPSSLTLEAHLPLSASSFGVLSGFGIPLIYEYIQESPTAEAPAHEPGTTF
ncbi:hypothetical protein [Bradymonas sediminis]|uniref:hypothetical protein n=1 Tax=Bradymonas sediminis TaxID=1548548 RepID=UPI00105E69A7|nr:hypothetical protein [Bradymonas sediminis]TDP62013.1 hypothetical protein DFR33_11529 [Bradymonas sediminis]